MFALSLLWIALGLAIGAMALWARLRPASWGRYGWAALLGVGALAALIGGWLGTLVYGRFFGAATAVWIAVLAVVLLPWLVNRRAASARTMSTPSDK